MGRCSVSRIGKEYCVAWRRLNQPRAHQRERGLHCPLHAGRTSAIRVYGRSYKLLPGRHTLPRGAAVGVTRRSSSRGSWGSGLGRERHRGGHQREKKESLKPTFSRILETVNRWISRSPSHTSPLRRCFACASIQYRSRTSPGRWSVTRVSPGCSGSVANSPPVSGCVTRVRSAFRKLGQAASQNGVPRRLQTRGSSGRSSSGDPSFGPAPGRAHPSRPPNLCPGPAAPGSARAGSL
jgi:hypothetical protein